MGIWSFYVLFTLLNLLAVFHLLILLEVIPHRIVWGGNIRSGKQLMLMEGLSLLVSIVFIFIIGAIQELWMVDWIDRNSIFILWVLFAFFLLSVIGNLFSKNHLEKRLFAPISLLMALASLGMMQL